MLHKDGIQTVFRAAGGQHRDTCQMPDMTGCILRPAMDRSPDVRSDGHIWRAAQSHAKWQKVCSKKVLAFLENFLLGAHPDHVGWSNLGMRPPMQTAVHPVDSWESLWRYRGGASRHPEAALIKWDCSFWVPSDPSQRGPTRTCGGIPSSISSS